MEFFVSLSPVSVALVIIGTIFVGYQASRAWMKRRQRVHAQRRKDRERRYAIAECARIVSLIKSATLGSAPEREKRKVRAYADRIAELVRQHRIDPMKDLGVHPSTLRRFVFLATKDIVDEDEQKRRAILTGHYGVSAASSSELPVRTPNGAIVLHPTNGPAQRSRAASEHNDPCADDTDPAAARTPHLVPVDELPGMSFDLVVIKDADIYAAVPDGATVTPALPEIVSGTETEIEYVDAESGITVVIDLSAFAERRRSLTENREKAPSAWRSFTDVDGFVEEAFSMLRAR